MIYILKDIELSFRIKNMEVEILKDFNLRIDNGELLILKGPSGSGKTTILNLIAGFLLPSKGQVLFRKKDLCLMSISETAAYRNKEIGMVYQSFNLIPQFDCLQNVMVPRLVASSNFKEAKSKATELLEKVGLLSRINHYPNELSGGEQQRVAIARALINKPSVILGDEPTGNLDNQTTKEIMQLLVDINREGTTFIIATHDDFVADMGSRTINVK